MPRIFEVADWLIIDVQKGHNRRKMKVLQLHI